MTQFQVCTEENGGRTFYVLKDAHTKASARILPSFGANCLELRLVAAPGDEPVAVINDLHNADNLEESPSRYGIPILFPWASGIAGGGFTFEGKRYQLNAPGEENPRYHGFVHTANWRVVESGCDNANAWLTCDIDSADCGSLAEIFPSRCSLRVSWRLSAEGMEMRMTAKNTGDASMPMGFGLHPYFPLPVRAGSSRSDCAITARVSRQWDLPAMTKTGPGDPRPAEVFLEEPQLPVSENKAAVMDDLKLNHVFEARHDGPANMTDSSLIDHQNGFKMTVSASRDFSTWVLYTPQDRGAVSLEPWTMAPNGFNLMAAGVEGTGVKTLKPGESWSGNVKFSLQRNDD